MKICGKWFQITPAFHSFYLYLSLPHEQYIIVQLVVTLVSHGQTAISAQGVYRLQYKRGNSGLAMRDYCNTGTSGLPDTAVHPKPEGVHMGDTIFTQSEVRK